MSVSPINRSGEHLVTFAPASYEKRNLQYNVNASLDILNKEQGTSVSSRIGADRRVKSKPRQYVTENSP
jgi:hypothetical protein